MFHPGGHRAPVTLHFITMAFAFSDPTKGGGFSWRWPFDRWDGAEERCKVWQVYTYKPSWVIHLWTSFITFRLENIHGEGKIGVHSVSSSCTHAFFVDKTRSLLDSNTGASTWTLYPKVRRRYSWNKIERRKCISRALEWMTKLQVT